MAVELGYFTLPVANVAKAQKFYGALFGWEFHAESNEGGGHVINTKFPMGLSPDGPAKLPTAYFQVTDIEASARQVSELGGKILERHVYPSGLNAVCEDDQGTVFSLWEPAPGFDMENG